MFAGGGGGIWFTDQYIDPYFLYITVMYNMSPAHYERASCCCVATEAALRVDCTDLNFSYH